MNRGWWGLSVRQTVALFAVAVLVGIGVALVLGPSGSDDGAGAPGTAITRIRPGSPAAPDALWVFGFETLRFGPGLTGGRQLRIQAFGDVAGAEAGVAMYDAGTGRVGFLDARRNRLRTVAQIAPGRSEPAPFVPTLASQGSQLWVVPNPGVVQRVDRATGAVSAPVPVVDDGAAATTGVVATQAAVFAATATAEGLVPTRVDVTGTPTVGAPIDGAALDGLAVDDRALWLRSGARLHALDPLTLTVTRTVTVPSRGGIGGVVTADGAVWMLTDGGASLTRYDVDRDRFVRAARLVARAPDAVELPAALVSDGTRVWAMVQRSGPRDLAVRVVEDGPTAERVRAVDVPGRIAPGALAVSTRGAAAPGPG
jgi:hypothetical protein